jgi:cell division protein FtsB
MTARKRATGATRADAGPSVPRTPGWIAARVLLAALAIGAIAFAVQGGEYGTTDLLSQRSALARQQAIVDSLEKRVAELAAYKKSVETDPVVQERIAREEFGMVKPGEVLYRFADEVPR